MTISFHCTNILEFDSEKQAYIHCGHVIQVTASQVGILTKCPKCQQRVEVPPVSDASLESRETPTAAVGTPSTVVQDQHAALHKPTPSGNLSYSSFGVSERCPKCGGAFQNNRCIKCGYQLRHYEQRQPLDRIALRPSGFVYSLNGRMSGMTFKQLMMVSHIAFGILAIVSMLLAATVDGIWSVVTMIPLGVLVAAYIVAAFQTHILTTSRAQPLNWWQNALWNAMLGLMRSRSFGLAKNERQLILTVTNPDFSDTDLDNFGQMNRCRVLDLSGTAITDRGLYKLHNLVNLRYLILQRTSVTPEGVFRLQQALQRVWVWY